MNPPHCTGRECVHACVCVWLILCALYCVGLCLITASRNRYPHLASHVNLSGRSCDHNHLTTEEDTLCPSHLSQCSYAAICHRYGRGSAGGWVRSGEPRGLLPVLSDPISIGAESLTHLLHYRSVISAGRYDNTPELQFEYKLSPRDTIRYSSSAREVEQGV